MAPCRLRSQQGCAGLRVIAVEPDAANRAVLGDRLRGLPGAAVLDCALAAEDGTAAFSEGYGFASKLSAFGQAQVSVRSIDSLDVEPSLHQAASRGRRT